jgi:hydroxymethylpyrimidine/phosphomethylpyrimidine kinase
MHMNSIPVALTIAGSDPSGGAGIQADLRTFDRHGVYGLSVITLMTAQNTMGVSNVFFMDAQVVGAQMDRLFADIQPNACKIGAVGSRDVIRALSARMPSMNFPLVFDPILESGNGVLLMDMNAKTEIIEDILPHVDLITPNLKEAEWFCGTGIRSVRKMEEAAKCMASMGPGSVLITGGHLEDDPVDVFYAAGEITHFSGKRVRGRVFHGTGCALTATITAHLARGETMAESVSRACKEIRDVLRAGEVMVKGARLLHVRAGSASDDPQMVYQQDREIQ